MARRESISSLSDGGEYDAEENLRNILSVEGQVWGKEEDFRRTVMAWRIFLSKEI